MSSLPERLTAKLEEKRMSQEDLAHAVGASQAAISKIIMGETKRSRFLPKIAEALETTEEWLVYGIGDSNISLTDVKVMEWDADTEIPDTMVAIPFFNGSSLSAGMGAMNSDMPYTGAVLWFAKSFIKRKGACLDRIFCVNISGDSMSPRYEDGGIAIIDTTNFLSIPDFEALPEEQRKAETLHRVIDGKVYAINYKGQDYIKRLGKTTSGEVIITSDNPAYGSDKALASDVCIVGRVIGYQREE